jgi:hypothetical protein
MKKLSFLLIAVLFFTSLSVFSQEVSKFSEIKKISKGHIFLNDGTKLKYKKLNVLNDTANFTIKDKGIFNLSENDILKITKTGNYATEGALILGLNGILLGLIFNNSNMENTYYTFGGNIINQMFLFALAGGIIGMFIPEEILVYKHKANVSFCPEINQFPDYKPGVLITFKINLN